MSVPAMAPPSVAATWGWVALGGAAGASLRYGAGLLATRWFGPEWPVGTLVVNLVGCFAIGLVLHAVTAQAIPAAARPALAVGLLGGLTTFSSFGFETWSLVEREAWGLALGNVVANVVGGLAATIGGLALSRSLWPVSS